MHTDETPAPTPYDPTPTPADIYDALTRARRAGAGIARGPRMEVVRRLFEDADESGAAARAAVVRVVRAMEGCGGVPLVVHTPRTLVLLDVSEVAPARLVNAPGGEA